MKTRHRLACFTFSAQLCAPLPGLPGVFLRRAFIDGLRLLRRRLTP